jgi:hypothetical protein
MRGTGGGGGVGVTDGLGDGDGDGEAVGDAIGDLDTAGEGDGPADVGVPGEMRTTTAGRMSGTRFVPGDDGAGVDAGPRLPCDPGDVGLAGERAWPVAPTEAFSSGNPAS